MRAFDPFPVASGMLGSSTIRIWRAHAAGSSQADPVDIGVVKSADASGVRVTCGFGELLITELQRANGKRVAAREFVSGALKAGDRFVSPHTLASE